MCIIAIKKAGVDLPNEEIINNMWYNNSDGAGFMYPYQGQVKIKKGYMTLTAFKAALFDLSRAIDIKDTPIILHFRIGTHGKNIAENTHPFPVTESIPALQKTRIKCPLGVVHNGIIDITPRKNISDTMEYILTQLAPLNQLCRDFYRRKEGKALVYNAIRSKMAFLDKEGNIETIGEFNEQKGILYSNKSYEPRMNYANWDIWDDYLWSDDEDGFHLETKNLMWLDAMDGYIIENGKQLAADDFLLDKAGNVYELNLSESWAVLTKARAYTHEGGNIPFDENRASPVDAIK